MVDVVSSLSLLGFLRWGDLTVWNKKNFPRVQTSKGGHNICGVGTKKSSGAKSKKMGAYEIDEFNLISPKVH